MCYKFIMEWLKVALLFCGIFWVSSFQIVRAEEINLGNVQKNQLNLKKPVVRDKKNLLIEDKASLEDLLKIQQDNDVKDIELLWEATVSSNNLIKFALKKLAIPEEKRRMHSSIMAKSLSALITTASFVPSLMGGNSMIQSASFATGKIANNYLNKQTVTPETPLTDTELIELAGMIESLQEQIVASYYNYKGSLNMLKETRARLILYNKNYTNAIKNGDTLEILISQALYDNARLEEYKQMENAKRYHLELQRLAGKKAMDDLTLYQFTYKTELFNQKLMRKQ